MAKRGLDKEQIISMAEILMTEKGYDNFSLREIAAKLGVKPASLYNHIDGIDEINAALVMRAAKKLKNSLARAVEGKLPDEAFVDGAKAYRRFAIENPELYKAFVMRPQLHNEEVMREGFKSFEPIREVIKTYGLSDRERLHFIRGLRSVMHGFIELTNNGYMKKEDVPRDETYEKITESYLAVLKSRAEKERKANE